MKANTDNISIKIHIKLDCSVKCTENVLIKIECTVICMSVIRDPLVSVITLTNKSLYLISYVRQTVSETTHLSPKDKNLSKDH